MAINREKVLEAAQKYVEKKKYDKAIIEFQKVIQEDPNDARTLLKVGDLQSKMEAYADAVGTYERVGKFYASQGFALKAIAVVERRALDQICGLRVYDEANFAERAHDVVIGDLGVEEHVIAVARAATRPDGNAQGKRLCALLTHQQLRNL